MSEQSSDSPWYIHLNSRTDGHQAPREVSKANLAKEGAQGVLDLIEPSSIDLIVGTRRQRNNGMRHSWSSSQCNLHRFGSSLGNGVEMSACTTRSSMTSDSKGSKVKERIRCAY